MNFKNEYYLSQPIEQSRPQRLDNQTFFGPIDTLNQSDFLQENNIRFFIGVGIPTSRLATICSQSKMLRDSMNVVTMVNFDPEFVAGQHYNNFEPQNLTSNFQRHNTHQLQQLVSFLVNDNQSNGVSRYLTPLPEKSYISKLLYGDVSHYYGSSVFNDTDVEKFKSFNDLLTIFKAYNPADKVLVFSNDGNDVELATMLISSVLKANPSVNVYEGLRYLKSLRSSLEDIKEERIIWCCGLLNYYECIRAKELFWGGIDGQTKPIRNLQNAQSASYRKRRESSMKTVEPTFALGTHNILVGGGTKRSRCNE